MNKPDRLTLTRITTAHPAIRQQLLSIYEEICSRLTGRAQCRFVEVLRSSARQAELYAQGRSKPGKIVTNAKAWESGHQFAMCCDICLIIDGKEASWSTIADFDRDAIPDWMEIVSVFDRNGWKWYGRNTRFPEAAHFENLLGHTVKELNSLRLAGKIDKEGYVLI